MNKYIEKLKSELAQYEVQCGDTSCPNILDTLWYCYFHSVPVDDGLIKEKDEALTPIFDALSVELSDILNELIVDVCTAYQRAAFLEGLRLGFSLIAELDPSSGNS